MRRIFTTAEYFAEGHDVEQLRWAVTSGAAHRLCRGVYVEGPDAPNAFHLAAGRMVASGKPLWGTVAGRLHNFDAMHTFPHAIPRRRQTEVFDSSVVTIAGLACTSALQTIVDMAELVDPLVWEQSLESGLRAGLFTIPDIEALVPRIAQSRRHGSPVIREVLALRPAGAPPTESLLETLAVQLIRTIPVPTPTRQYEIVDEHGIFVARVDLCWPELGVFMELDGKHHRDQQLHDANRASRIVAATGWLYGRFNWREIRYDPAVSGRRLLRIIEQARTRPVAQLVRG